MAGALSRTYVAIERRVRAENNVRSNRARGAFATYGLTSVPSTHRTDNGVSNKGTFQ